jgi:hypothetical protein
MCLQVVGIWLVDTVHQLLVAQTCELEHSHRFFALRRHTFLLVIFSVRTRDHTHTRLELRGPQRRTVGNPLSLQSRDVAAHLEPCEQSFGCVLFHPCHWIRRQREAPLCSFSTYFKPSRPSQFRGQWSMTLRSLAKAEHQLLRLPHLDP